MVYIVLRTEVAISLNAYRYTDFAVVENHKAAAQAPAGDGGAEADVLERESAGAGRVVDGNGHHALIADAVDLSAV